MRSVISSLFRRSSSSSFMAPLACTFSFNCSESSEFCCLDSSLKLLHAHTRTLLIKSQQKVYDKTMRKSNLLYPENLKPQVVSLLFKLFVVLTLIKKTKQKNMYFRINQTISETLCGERMMFLRQCQLPSQTASAVLTQRKVFSPALRLSALTTAAGCSAPPPQLRTPNKRLVYEVGRKAYLIVHRTVIRNRTCLLACGLLRVLQCCL